MSAPRPPLLSDSVLQLINPCSITLSQPGNILLKGSRQDRRGFTVRISDFGFSTMQGAMGEWVPCRAVIEGY